MKKKIFLFSLFVLTMLMLPFKLSASVEPIMITANPGEDAASEIGISWHMDLDQKEGKVIYTKKTDEDWEDAIIIEGHKDVVTIFYGMEFYHYTANLKNLESNTEYMYKVGQDVMSHIHYFKTAGRDEFNFLWVSDWHAWEGNPRRVNNFTKVVNHSRAIEPNIDFMFSTGDDITYGSDYEGFRYTHEQQQYTDFLSATTVGNHDVINNVLINGVKQPNTDEFFLRTHNFPKNGYPGQEGASYYYNYGPALFIVLNNEDLNKQKSTRLPGIQAWVKKVIDENPAQYIIVAMHYQWFDGRKGQTNAQYRDWSKFFDENKVDLAMAGNNHVYLRTNRVYNNLETGTTKGTVYMQAPSSDGERGVVISDLTNNTHIIKGRWSAGSNTIGAVIVNVTQEKMMTRLVDGFGNVRETAEFSSRYKDYEFDKDAFLKSIEGKRILNEDNQAIITADAEGLKFVDRIEYYENDVLLDINYFYKTNHLAYKIENVTDFNNLIAKVKFYDGTDQEIKLINDNYYNLENVEVIVEGKQASIVWDYNLEDDFNLYIYDEDNLIEKVSVKEQKLNIDSSLVNKTLTIKPEIDSNIGYYQVKNNLFGDVNNDYLINTDDVLDLANYLVGNKDLHLHFKEFLDIDLDGELTTIDLTYIHLYINREIKNLIKETYTVKFYDLKGNLIYEEEVYRGEDIIPPEGPEYELYKFINWDKSLTNISDNLDVRPNYIWVGEQ